MKKTFQSHSPEETYAIAQDILKAYKDKTSILCLFGDLGSGKTTFVKGIGKVLGIQKIITSPTFTLIKEYPIPDTNKKLIHIDLYRIKDSSHAIQDLHLEDYFTEDFLTCIEWPESIFDDLPQHKIALHFEYMSENKRTITLG